MRILNNTYTASNIIRLVHSGADYFDQLENIILNTEREIHIQTYIFNNDTIGKRIVDALKTAASRNVKVYILADSFGSNSLKTEFTDDLKKHNIHIRYFSPLLSSNSFYIGRRLHHKVVVADAETILIGGINIADKYFETETPWLDYAVLLKNSKLGTLLQELCKEIYLRKWKTEKKKISTILQNGEISSISILQNDWFKGKSQIHNAYIRNIKAAKSEIVIVGSYFLPGKKIIRALEKASQNNVNIKLVLSGIADVPFSKRATSYFYSKLLLNNIEIYEWNKSVLHGKTAVIDRHWTTIGSFNLNNLSSYGSIEMNVAIESKSFAENYLEDLELVISQCQRITTESLLTNHTWQNNIKNWFSFWIARIGITIVTYLPYKRFLKIS